MRKLKPVGIPTHVNLKDLRVGGFAAANVFAGEKLPVTVRAALTSDQSEFHGYLQQICNHLGSRAKEVGVLLPWDKVCSFLLVRHDDWSAELYAPDFPMSLEILSKRTVATGE